MTRVSNPKAQNKQPHTLWGMAYIDINHIEKENLILTDTVLC